MPDKRAVAGRRAQLRRRRLGAHAGVAEALDQRAVVRLGEPFRNRRGDDGADLGNALQLIDVGGGERLEAARMPRASSVGRALADVPKPRP